MNYIFISELSTPNYELNTNDRILIWKTVLKRDLVTLR